MAQDVFESIADLEAYMTGYANGMSAEEARSLVPLVAETLKKNIQHHIDMYYAEGYDSPAGDFYGALLHPNAYRRTKSLRKSLDNVSIDVVETVSKSKHDIYCEFTFDEDMARSESIFNSDEKSYPDYDGNRVDLIQGGWEVKSNKVWFKDRWHMGYYEGYDFIGKAITDTLAQVNTKNMIDIYVTGARNVSASSPNVYIK